jgi:aminobutyraldehyde dehydrogenase
MISLTGDIATGKKVLRRRPSPSSARIWNSAARRRSSSSTTPTSRRRGRGVRAFGYYNAGQDCTAACRIYAGAKVYDNLVADLTSAVSSIAYGGRGRQQNEIGPLISRASATAWPASSSAPPSRSTSRSPPAGGSATATASTTADGGRRRAAGRRDRAREVFGPVVSVTRFSDVDRRRLGQRFRLRPRLLGLDRATSAAPWPPPRLQYGCTWINTHFMLVNEMPHGGLKQSGYGKDMSTYALEDYTVVRHVMIAQSGLTKAWVATAPTPPRRCGTRAPTAKKRLATATPKCPVAGSRATIE